MVYLKYLFKFRINVTIHPFLLYFYFIEGNLISHWHCLYKKSILFFFCLTFSFLGQAYEYSRKHGEYICLNKSDQQFKSVHEDVE